MKIKESELVVNPDGRVYHLNLAPEELADRVILVGDPGRVPVVAAHFDAVELRRENREIHSCTGTYRGRRFTVLSTGMGPDNIDIVMNELDALKNIDLVTREIKEKKTSLDIVRIGTSGSLQRDIPVDSFVVARRAIGFDGVLHFYKSQSVRRIDIEDAFIEQTRWNPLAARPYVVDGNRELFERLHGPRTVEGFTATAVGFYGPQGRELRIPLADPQANDKLEKFAYKGLRLTNYEMETSAIYGLSALLGHRACSTNCIVAARTAGVFSKDAHAAVERLIAYVLDRLTGEERPGEA